MSTQASNWYVDLLLHLFRGRIWDSSVITDWNANFSESVRQKQRFFCSPKHPDKLRGKTLSFPVGTTSPLLGVRGPGREATYSAEAKNAL
jgi:hypothetical protein